MLYETVVLFGLVMTAGLTYGLVSQQRHALSGRHGLQAFVFLVVGLYFAWFWSHGGQTVAMKAWRVRLVGHDGMPVQWPRAVARYLASWLWCLPVLVLAYATPWRTPTELWGLLAAWMGMYAASALLTRDRQFWHDRLCATHLVHEPLLTPDVHNARP